MRPLIATAAALGLLAAGCSTAPLDAPLAPSFGTAVASMDRQIIDPTAAQGRPETSAAAAVEGIRRLEQNRVTEPYGSYTERSAGGSGGNVGGGSGDGSGSSGSSGSTTP